MNWRHQAACRGEDPRLFFPDGDDGMALDQIAVAKSVCRRCPVVQLCRAEAIAGDYDGIWGGTTERERGKPRDGFVEDLGTRQGPTRRPEGAASAQREARAS